MNSHKQNEWISLFDGKTLAGWKATENVESFQVKDGAIVVDGDRSHLFYTGDIAGHEFKNFELKLKIYTFPEANSGVYFHTKYQEKGFPGRGYEVQVNNSHTDRIRTASLYNIKNVYEKHASDHEWFEMHIKVVDKHVQVKVDGELVVEYTEIQEGGKKDHTDRFPPTGTFALQAHDPNSKIMYKDIMVRVID